MIEGNEVDEETQWRKLELVARVADRVWPTMTTARSQLVEIR